MKWGPGISKEMCGSPHKERVGIFPRNAPMQRAAEADSGGFRVSNLRGSLKGEAV